jgi:hypothetical protein
MVEKTGEGSSTGLSTGAGTGTGAGVEETDSDGVELSKADGISEARGLYSIGVSIASEPLFPFRSFDGDPFAFFLTGSARRVGASETMDASAGTGVISRSCSGSRNVMPLIEAFDSGVIAGAGVGDGVGVGTGEGKNDETGNVELLPCIAFAADNRTLASLCSGSR